MKHIYEEFLDESSQKVLEEAKETIPDLCVDEDEDEEMEKWRNGFYSHTVRWKVWRPAAMAPWKGQLVRDETQCWVSTKLYYRQLHNRR